MGSTITKAIVFAGFLVAAMYACQGPGSASDVRSTEKFTIGWRFIHNDDLEKGGTPADASLISGLGYDDTAWNFLDLPHDWSITEPYHIDNPGRFGTSFMIGGVGWYRKRFFMPEASAGKHTELTFEGVYQNSTVWINGHDLGTRPYGYITFIYNLTPYLKYGGEHVIVVRVDNYITRFGIRYFHFEPYEGFFFNGHRLKIKGVCLHHDLGALGAAFNRGAMERQLEIMRSMGVNAIRTAHNLPAPGLLHLCDEMGFLVMNETFDTWAMPKTDYDADQVYAFNGKCLVIIRGGNTAGTARIGLISDGLQGAEVMLTL